MHAQPFVVLIGPPAAGKSGIGRKVSRYLGAPFLDTDSRIAQQHGPIADIFRDRGEEEFRRLEREVVTQALTEPAVVSLGGGAMLDPQTQEQLRGQRVVLLTVDATAVAKRLSGSKRPLLAAETPQERIAAWSALAESRRELYERLAVASWDTSSRSISAIARDIADWARAQTEESTQE